jgi:hypothetical protein
LGVLMSIEQDGKVFHEGCQNESVGGGCGLHYC